MCAPLYCIADTHRASPPNCYDKDNKNLIHYIPSTISATASIVFHVQSSQERNKKTSWKIVYTEKGFSLFSVFKVIAWDSRSFIYRKEKTKREEEKLNPKQLEERAERLKILERDQIVEHGWL